MRRFKGAEVADLGADKKKMRGMLLLLALVVAALVGTQLALPPGEERAAAPDLPDAGGEAVVALPTFPPGTWEALEDATAEQRLVLEAGAVEVLAARIGNLTAAQFEALEPRPLDAAAVAELEADPAAARGRAFSARGAIVRLDASPGLGVSNERVLGTLELEDGARAHFVALRRSEPPFGVGDYVRLDGLFVKRFRDELGASGEWLDAPLLVAPRLIASARDFGPVPELPEEFWAGVSDDRLDGELAEDREGLPEEQKWRLLAWIRDAPPETFDWQAAQTLDSALMEIVARDGSVFRGQPFLLPISRLQDVRERRAPENPARLEHVTEAWIGNQTWSPRAPALHVLLPGRQQGDLVSPASLIGPDSATDFVTARLVYWKNIAYTTRDNVRRVAPVFLGVELAKHVPPRDNVLPAILLGFVALLAAMAVTLFLLVRRDRRQSEALERKLVERRRARRERTSTPRG